MSSTVIVAGGGGPRLGSVLLTVGILGVAALIWWKGPKVIEDVKKVFTEKLNPTSNKNIAYQAVSSLVGGNLGIKIYDWTHPNQGTANSLPKKVITPADVEDTGAGGPDMWEPYGVD